MAVIDFLVCGAGIAGASIAAELALAGTVTIIEREDVAGYHTTGRSAALYIPSYGNQVIRGLTAASRAFFDAPPEGFADGPGHWSIPGHAAVLLAPGENAHPQRTQSSQTH